jgi:acyl-CoA thioesterase I
MPLSSKRARLDGTFDVMLSFAFTVAILLAAAMPAGARDRAPAPRIVCLGDSLTSGHGIGTAQAYPAVLQRRLDEQGLRYAVVNAGVSRETSADAMRRLPRALDGDVRVLVVALGANDGLRGVPVEQLKANLGRIIGAAQARGIDVVLCGMEALPIYGWNYSVAFHRAYQELAAIYHVPLVPFVMMNVLGNPQLMQPDHVHPNAAGARAIADRVWPYLLPVLKSAE